MKKRNFLPFVIPIVITLIFTTLNFFDFYKTGDEKIYDTLLHFRKSIPEDPSILLVDIDDPSIAQVGVWPWNRSIMADGLILMKEMGANTAIFDIEYTEKSPLSVNSQLLEQELPELFSSEFASLNQNITDLFNAIASGSISVEDASDYIKQLVDMSEETRNMLLKKVADIAWDNDNYLGQSAYFFGNSFFTVNMLPGKEDKLSKEDKEFILDKISLKNVTLKNNSIITAEDIRPAIAPIIQKAQGAGFPNVPIDNDGVMRRINLVQKYDNKFFGQLVFTPLLHAFGNPEVIVMEDSIILKGAKVKGSPESDIKIPLSTDGRLLVNFTHNNFANSFRHLSYYELVYNKKLENRIVANLKTLREAGYLSYYNGEGDLLSGYTYAEKIKKEVLSGGELSLIKDYVETRKYFIDELGNFLTGSAEKDIISDIDNILASREVDEQTKNTYEAVKSEVPGNFKALRDLYNEFTDSRTLLSKALKDSFCIIGQTGTSTTDIGVTPFEKEYMNVGIHANIANTIFARSFLDTLPWWYSSILALVFSFLLAVLIKGRKPLPSVAFGFVFVVGIISAMAGYFIMTGVFLSILTPAISVFLTLILLFVVNFFTLEKEKSFLRNAFSHYLSSDVINELLSDPDKLNLGGEKKDLTALFTDVQGFSTISESLDPTDLVRLLNEYLTAMSDIILNSRGTIDKYEGDAIIAFFGAPLEYPTHAASACHAAVQMKRIESELNERFIAEQMTPSPLFTRIGINTGPMVVGNMGTPRKMDYTIMGNAVNLAARLEGVNKQYGTGVLISELTYKSGGEGFAVRKLDRVRVVGINTPVRLYELMEEKSVLDERISEGIAVFHRALELFEKREWEKAQEIFMSVMDIIPDDGPAKTYMARCKEYIRKPPKKTWDGVFNLTTK